MNINKLTEDKVVEIYEFMYNNKGMTKCEFARNFSLTCQEIDLLTQGHTSFPSYYEYTLEKQKAN